MYCWKIEYSIRVHLIICHGIFILAVQFHALAPSHQLNIMIGISNNVFGTINEEQNTKKVPVMQCRERCIREIQSGLQVRTRLTERISCTPAFKTFVQRMRFELKVECGVKSILSLDFVFLICLTSSKKAIILNNIAWVWAEMHVIAKRKH